MLKFSILECRPREAIQNLERRAEKGQREYGSSFKAGKIRKKEQRWSVSPKAMVIKMPSPNFFFLSLLCPIGETVDQLREIAGLQETLLRASQDGARNGNRSHRAGNRNSCIAINFLCAV